MDRLLSDRIDIRGPGECWIWKGTISPDGYGRCTTRKWRDWRAHRAVYTDVFGTIPDGLSVLHTCDVPLCCNPTHLWLGTNQQNTDDMMMKGRHRHGQIGLEIGQRLRKLPLSEYPAVRELYASGVTQIEVGHRFEISQQLVSNIVRV